MIPKILHQVFLSFSDESIEEKRAAFLAEWATVTERNREMHPDWEYRLWTDAEVFPFVQSEYPELFDIFVTYPKPIMRADVVRYLIMHRIGGVYLDFDYEFLRPFDLNDHSMVLPENRSVHLHGFHRIGNCVFGSSPGHDFWPAVFEELLSTGIPGVPEVDVEDITGPGMLTRVVQRINRQDFMLYSNVLVPSCDGNASILSPKAELFHPKSPRSERERQRIIERGVAYGIHYCSGTWRTPQPLFRRAFSKLRRIITSSRN